MSKLQEELKKRYFGLRSTCFSYFNNDEEGSPKLFKKYLDGELGDDSASYFELGTQTHMFLLEPDEFKKNYTFLSFTKPRGEKQNEFCERLVELIQVTNKKAPDLVEQAYREVYAVSKKSDAKIKEESINLYKSLLDYIEYLLTRTKYKEVLDFSTMRYLKEAKNEVQKHEVAKDFIIESIIDNENVFNQSEQRIYWEHPLFQYKGEPLVLRSTLDKLIIDHKEKKIKLIDVKTSGKLNKFTDSFEKYKYHRQLASYWMAVMYFIKTEDQFKDIDFSDYKRETYIVGIQTPNRFKELPIECKVFPVSEETLGEGLKLLNSNIDDVLWHLENNKWDHSRIYYMNKGLELEL